MRKLALAILIIFSFSAAIFAQNNCRDISFNSSDGLLAITRYSNGIGKSGFVDVTGKVIVEPKYDEVYPFSNGLALVKSGDKFGFIDRNGTEVIRPQFDNACSFSEELAAVKISGKYGYIDKEGRTKIQPQFDKAYSFSEGLARIEVFVKVDPRRDAVEKQYGYIDKEGRLVIPAIFDAASDFRGGVAKVIDSIYGLETYINREGKFIARKTNSPTDVFGYAPALVEIKIESRPGGANIYLIPTRRWDCDPARSRDCDPNLLSRDEGSLNEFLVPTGATPTNFKAKQKHYTVLLILNGVRKQAPLDVRPDASNSVSVSFQ
jgi:hypothetical protein